MVTTLYPTFKVHIISIDFEDEMLNDFYFSRGEMVRLLQKFLLDLNVNLSKFSMRTPHLANYPKVFGSCSQYCSDPTFDCRLDLANWSPQSRLVFKRWFEQNI